jgi:hypothetical protein
MRCCIASSTTSRLKDQHNQRFRWRPGPGECRKNAPCRYPERLGGPWRNEGFGRKGVAKGGGPQGSPLAAFSPLARPTARRAVYGLPRRFWPAAATMAVSVQPPARRADPPERRMRRSPPRSAPARPPDRRRRRAELRRRIGRRRIGGGGPLTQVSLRVALAASMRPVKVAFEVAR